MKLFFQNRKLMSIALVLIIICIIGLVVEGKRTRSGNSESVTNLPLPTIHKAIIATPITGNVKEIVISDDDNGSIITLQQGTQIRIILHSTYWIFNTVMKNMIVKQLYKPIYASDTSVRTPGTGVGTVTVEYRAVGIGQATVSASRASCGEAMRCIEHQAKFLIHIIVN
ncbi:MAG TPA: hypothetical protein VNW29_02645 [Candidatus Sulfotelmatobacter sp.]|jgi:hypothetical protein|nr:hypothetical protein [Candidatus Sulfotelmatobacter sp.]